MYKRMNFTFTVRDNFIENILILALEFNTTIIGFAHIIVQTAN